ncbi:hypothetical protein PR202_gb01686 [Eleusine coracana subsp. coracana]|uniref:Uncharacterized protein n=1 Tax=Eleusine coracana subsp. coracana TaxID=191504 RepID=A0AAV5DWV1_ELECO|nr:hypothetical protein PR202_gb01686 [Eleusine coracana subsp. coracana]
MIERTEEQIRSSTRQSKTQQHRQEETRPRLGTSLLRIVRGVFESLLGIHLPRRGGYQQGSHSQSDEGPELDVKAEVTKHTRQD